jgi:hypothetical protein
MSPPEMGGPVPQPEIPDPTNLISHPKADTPSVIDAETIEPMSAADAARLDQRIRLLTGDVNDKLEKLYKLVEQAKRGEIHKVLGFASWTASV